MKKIVLFSLTLSLVTLTAVFALAQNTGTGTLDNDVTILCDSAWENTVGALCWEHITPFCVPRVCKWTGHQSDMC